MASEEVAYDMPGTDDMAATVATSRHYITFMNIGARHVTTAGHSASIIDIYLCRQQHGYLKEYRQPSALSLLRIRP